MVSYANDRQRQPLAGTIGKRMRSIAWLLLIGMCFLGPEKGGLLDQLGVELDGRGNVKADETKMTSVPGVFVAGDMTRGQSLIVWAIAEGRDAALGIDTYLMGESALPNTTHRND